MGHLWGAATCGRRHVAWPASRRLGRRAAVSRCQRVIMQPVASLLWQPGGSVKQLTWIHQAAHAQMC